MAACWTLPDTYRPALKPGVVLNRLDSSDSAFEYLVSFGKRHWRVGSGCYDVVRLCEGNKSISEIQGALATEGEFVAARLVERVFNEFIIPNGLVERGPDDHPLETPPYHGRDSFLAMRITLLSGRILDLITAGLQYLFSTGVVLPVLFLALAVRIPALNFWFIGGGRALGHTGGVLLALFCLLPGIFFHELGHVSACRRYGATYGDIGFGIHMVFPVLYADVRASWVLPRRQRLVVDAGGVYFQCLFSTCFYLAYLVTGHGYLLLAAVVQDTALVANLMPFFKWDGYWFLADLLGIPNLADSAVSTLRAAVRRRCFDDRWTLPRWMIVVLCSYGLLLLSVYALFFGTVIWTFPSVIQGAPRLVVDFVQSLGRLDFEHSAELAPVIIRDMAVLVGSYHLVKRGYRLAIQRFHSLRRTSGTESLMRVDPNSMTLGREEGKYDSAENTKNK